MRAHLVSLWERHDLLAAVGGLVFLAVAFKLLADDRRAESLGMVAISVALLATSVSFWTMRKSDERAERLDQHVRAFDALLKAQLDEQRTAGGD